MSSGGGCPPENKKTIVAPSEAFKQLSLQRLRLEFLWLEGKGDSDDADALRDEMDVPWNALSDEEQGLSRRWSAAVTAFFEGDQMKVETTP